MGSAFGKMKVRVLVVGLDNSGKTSIVNFLRNNKNEILAPTVGYNNESVEKYNLNFTFIDMSGKQEYRDMWEQFAQKIDGLIFVIDSVDELRFTIMANELQILLESEGFDTKIPLLLYANKADQHEAKQAQFFGDFLKLQKIRNPSHCISSSTKSGEGIEQGLQWMSSQIQMVRKK